MKITKIISFTFCLMAFSSIAQTEISGLLDSDPTDGITEGAIAKYKLPAAIEACRELAHDGKTDWYLPSVQEALLFAVNADNPGDYKTTNMLGCIGNNCDSAHYYFWSRSSRGTGTPDKKAYTLLVSGVGTFMYGCLSGDTEDFSWTDKDGKTDSDATYRIYSSSTSCQIRVRCVR